MSLLVIVVLADTGGAFMNVKAVKYSAVRIDRRHAVDRNDHIHAAEAAPLPV